jgi:hypothetical protein
MKVEKDYEEFLRLLNKNKVRYCIVGAYAVALYARPRYTKDMDIFVEADQDNARKLVKVLKEFGFEDLELSEDDFMKEGTIIQLGYEPVRIDLLTSLPGCSFQEVWENKQLGDYGDEKVFYIGLEDLIRNKTVSNRKQDEADLELLLPVKNIKK